MSAAGVAGPLFISVGQPEQLSKFLALNPELAQAKALIDDSPDFAAYKSAGFNYLMGDRELKAAPDFKPPRSMGMGKWFTYLNNVISLSPVPKGTAMKLGDVPPGVKVLGGTYAIDGERVAFSHMDEVPGATPDIEDVLKAIGA